MWKLSKTYKKCKKGSQIECHKIKVAKKFKKNFKSFPDKKILKGVLKHSSNSDIVTVGAVFEDSHFIFFLFVWERFKMSF